MEARHARWRDAVFFGVTAGVAVAGLPGQTLWAQLQDTPAAPVEAGAGSQALCALQVIGNRRIPKDSVLARISSHQIDRENGRPQYPLSADTV